MTKCETCGGKRWHYAGWSFEVDQVECPDCAFIRGAQAMMAGRLGNTNESIEKFASKRHEDDPICWCDLDINKAHSDLCHLYSKDDSMKEIEVTPPQPYSSEDVASIGRVRSYLESAKVNRALDAVETSEEWMTNEQRN